MSTVATTEPTASTPYWVEEGRAAGGRSRFLAKISGLHCSLCTGTIEKAVGRLPGVHKVAVSLTHEQALAEFDPALATPTKPIGQPLSDEEAERLREGGRAVGRDGSGAWRRMTASPVPLAVLELSAIRQLLVSGAIVIAAGGGGPPVYRDPLLGLEGVDAVVDKDRVAAILAREGVTVTPELKDHLWSALNSLASAPVNERTLTEDQVQTLVAWAKAGAPAGDAADAPPARQWTNSEWSIGEPDLIVDMGTDYFVPDELEDQYVYFETEITKEILPEPRWLKAFEFRPGGPVVHHIIARPLGGIAPGNDPQVYDDGFARLLTPGWNLRHGPQHR